MIDKALKSREDKVRRQLAKQGFFLSKSRTKGVKTIDGVTYPLEYDFGGYMIMSSYNGFPVAGDRYSFSLEDVERFATE